MKINRNGIVEDMTEAERGEYSARSIGNLIDTMEETWEGSTEKQKIDALFLLLKKTNGR